MNIIEACKNGNVSKVKEALERGDDPTMDDNLAIQIACKNGFTDIVKILLQDGRADPSESYNYSIKWASRQGYLEIVKALLEDGRADPTAYSSWALRLAVMYNHTDVVEALLQDGRVDSQHYICLACTEEVREMLLKYKYRVDGQEYQKLKAQL